VDIERNIVTVEDPIEYQLPGITQIQVKPQIGLNFATLLRSILRHDPDIIMIGEIRDIETAQIAVQAALTGHLVLSTLHTNSAAATIARLRDMGLEDYLTATLNGILAQRLVRRLCETCKRPAQAIRELIARFELDRISTGPITIYEPSGCPACRGTGNAGRIAVSEFLTPDETTHRLILSRAGHAEIQRAACASGMQSMYESALLRNGVGLVIALGISRDVLRHLSARKIVDDAVGRVKSGERVATALAKHRFFPAQTIHLLQIGEETGSSPPWRCAPPIFTTSRCMCLCSVWSPFSFPS
jgi:type II secretory ATPase GspE/PulE/Tfp pilus assembly ATPase PilB-like protein